ncbi:MAG TPA: YqgE/AlgH family protein [Steroidobacteraceae bacterium]|nr:YqgE/AlgH family protein [Steroidobacteraceae bacterium]
MMRYASPTNGSSSAAPRRAPASIIRSRTISDSGYLTNQLLIAMPLMGDPNFAQTVALVCDHSSRGALGLILNKPLPMRMGEIFAQLEIELSTGPLRERQVLRGGPMQTDRGFVVHRAGGEWDSTLKVSDVIHVTTSRDILAAMASGQGPQEAVVALGYAGWDGGQLEDEIRANAWLNAPVDPDLIFELPFESRWQAAGRLLGVELSQISPISGNA